MSTKKTYRFSVPVIAYELWECEADSPDQAREIFERDGATFVSVGSSEREDGGTVEVVGTDGTHTEFEL